MVRGFTSAHISTDGGIPPGFEEAWIAEKDSNRTDLPDLANLPPGSRIVLSDETLGEEVRDVSTLSEPTSIRMPNCTTLIPVIRRKRGIQQAVIPLADNEGEEDEEDEEEGEDEEEDEGEEGGKQAQS